MDIILEQNQTSLIIMDFWWGYLKHFFKMPLLASKMSYYVLKTIKMSLAMHLLGIITKFIAIFSTTKIWGYLTH